ncbi:hypothetical protein KXS11_16510 [Plantibacter flavus]|uniref:hypothetical protein n=1 Tax=Plantibacter flavus TaxID=150123 RepID=UPI003F14E507
MMDILIPAVVFLVVAFFVGVQLSRAWSTGRWAASDRYHLITSAVDSIVALALVRAVATPVGVWSWVWVVAVAAVGFGIAGAALRWRDVPWHAPKPKRTLDADGVEQESTGPSNPRGRQTMAGAYALVGAAVVALCW